MTIKTITQSCLRLTVLLSGIAAAVQYDFSGVDWTKVNYAQSFFTISGAAPLLSERVDPNMYPGETPSPHVHDIFGGNGFSPKWDYNTAVKSSCNNVGPDKDHSNYWFPAMFHKAADGILTRLKSDITLYYHFGVQDNGPRHMFPKGFKMVAGTPALRKDDSATNKATQSIEWCKDKSGQSVKGALPKLENIVPCTGSRLRGMIWFPFCTDNINSADFDPKDTAKHVRYGEGPTANGGKCPSSHPYALPQIQLEVFYDVGSVLNKGGSLVLAHGDTTGYGFHADFVNGWEGGEKSLEEGIKPKDGGTVCQQGFGGKPCFNELSAQQKGACKLSQFKKEETQNPGKALPGCNPIFPETKECSQKRAVSFGVQRRSHWQSHLEKRSAHQVS